MTDSELIEVWFRIERGEDGYPGLDWEVLWCQPTEGGLRVESIPFYVKGIAVGDVLATKETEQATYEFDRVIDESDHDTYRIWLSKEFDAGAETVQQHLRELCCGVDSTLGRLIAIDVPPDKKRLVREFLYEGVGSKKWDLEEGSTNEDN